MPWAWIEPEDPSVLDVRPLLDLGCGDGQATAVLARTGMVVGLDRSLPALRGAGRSGSERLVQADARHVPVRDSALGGVLAADIFHHLTDADLEDVMFEIRRLLRPGGRLVAWWYALPPRHSAASPDAPRFARPYDAVAAVSARAGLPSQPLAVRCTVEPAPPTAALLAVRPGGS